MIDIDPFIARMESCIREKNGMILPPPVVEKRNDYDVIATWNVEGSNIVAVVHENDVHFMSNFQRDHDLRGSVPWEKFFQIMATML